MDHPDQAKHTPGNGVLTVGFSIELKHLGNLWGISLEGFEAEITELFLAYEG